MSFFLNHLAKSGAKIGQHILWIFQDLIRTYFCGSQTRIIVIQGADFYTRDSNNVPNFIFRSFLVILVHQSGYNTHVKMPFFSLKMRKAPSRLILERQVGKLPVMSDDIIPKKIFVYAQDISKYMVTNSHLYIHSFLQKNSQKNEKRASTRDDIPNDKLFPCCRHCVYRSNVTGICDVT